MAWLRESPIWPLIQKHIAPEAAPAPRMSTEQSWFERLSPSARQVLAVADGMRQAVQSPWPKIFLEYLITALAEEAGGPLPALMNRRGISLQELMANIRERSRTDIPPSGSYQLPFLNTPPELSSYAREALEFASKAADVQRSDRIESTHLLHGVLSVTDSPLVHAMAAMGLSRELISAEPVNEPLLVGFRPDDLQGEDRLGIDSEVQALVSVLAASDVAPPLSLGLFGDWGSGKSFFMRRLEKAIDAVAATAAPGYCEKIVQIRFNAWSYIDTQNLWASLTSEIFEQLAQKLSSGDTVTAATKRAQLLAATDSSRNVLAEAQQQKESVETSLHQSEERLQKLESAEEDLRTDLRDLKLNRTTLQRILETTGLQKQAEELSSKLQLPLKQALTPEGIEQLLELRSLSGRLRAFRQSLAARPSGERRNFLLLLLLCLGLPVLALFVTPYFIDAWKELCGLLGVAGIAGLVLKLRPFLEAAKSAAKELETAWNAATIQIEERKQARRQELEKERTALTDQLDQARKSVDEATQALRDVEAQLDALRADRQVSDFIRKRHQSTDYTQHLGVIARAQQDFERLTELLKAAREERSNKPSELPRIDRIILYIDDLDRCPEDKVVDVLQAVHLLLAFELFVVVVGVDSRWLLHSLQQNSKVFQSSLRKDSGMSTEEQHHWQSTPLNYLEKIFQIPYALRVMEPEGFGALIDDLTRAAAAEAPPAALQAPLGSAAPQPALPAPAQPAPEPKPVLAPEAMPVSASEPPPPPPAPLLLRITDEERRYMKALHGFIPSPRSAKRFVNTYRLLHASLPSNERTAFVGSPERPGECLSAQLLLAMLIGHPAEATQVLEALVEHEPTGSWWDFIFDFFADETAREGSLERWEELKSRMEELRKQRIFPEDLTCGPFVKWAPRVARYSFQARSVLMARKRTATPAPRKVSKAS
ncbi:hypothetical protein JYJ95_41210 [Corallococcus exiguus]|uniref:P-loop NTPase fold protein n=1 Tax=Corallococcus exiguus TaxID=83462 RepID=UPI001A8E4D30|nr:P-loop NTPase fold protein [Corallococcus exiguus]MBN8472964.1 hypothetical protein [Corallococcus exiguus]